MARSTWCRLAAWTVASASIVAAVGCSSGPSEWHAVDLVQVYFHDLSSGDYAAANKLTCSNRRLPSRTAASTMARLMSSLPAGARRLRIRSSTTSPGPYASLPGDVEVDKVTVHLEGGYAPFNIDVAGRRKQAQICGEWVPGAPDLLYQAPEPDPHLMTTVPVGAVQDLVPPAGYQARRDTESPKLFASVPGFKGGSTVEWRPSAGGAVVRITAFDFDVAAGGAYAGRQANEGAFGSFVTEAIAVHDPHVRAFRVLLAAGIVPQPPDVGPQADVAEISFDSRLYVIQVGTLTASSDHSLLLSTIGAVEAAAKPFPGVDLQGRYDPSVVQRPTDKA